MNRFLLALTVLLLVSMQAIKSNAQELVTDRPDQTESSSVVPAGRFQVESGLVLERVGTSGELDELSRTSFGTLLRLGLTDRLELRVAAAHGRTRSYLPCFNCLGDRDETIASGFEDVAVGTKVAITSEEGFLPEMALLLHVGLPVNTSQEIPYHSVVDFRFSMSHTLSERFSLGYNLGVESSNRENRGAGVYTLALGADIYEAFGGYIELFGRLSLGVPPEHSIDGGVTWAPVEALQFDLSGGIGFQPTNAGSYLGVGVSFRLPE